MNVQLPTWVQYAQALLTPAVAFLAILIGVMQWRTAHLRAVLDLFDRRMTAYQRIREVVAEVISSGTVSNKTSYRFDQACDGTDFLFGAEVTACLRQLGKALAEHRIAEADFREAQQTGNAHKRSKAYEAQETRFAEIKAFYAEFEKHLRRYMRMHQKAPWF